MLGRGEEYSIKIYPLFDTCATYLFHNPSRYLLLVSPFVGLDLSMTAVTIPACSAITPMGLIRLSRMLCVEVVILVFF